MKKLLLAFVLLTGTAEAVTYDTIGLIAARTGLYDPTPTQYGNWATVSADTYTAEVGDTVTNFFVEDSNSATISISIYTWVAGAPAARVFSDTLTTDGAALSIDSMTTKFGLSAGTTYSIEACVLTVTGTPARWGSSGTPANGVHYKAASCLTDPYPGDATGAAYHFNLAARVTKYGADAPATTQLSIGPVSAGPVSAGP